MDDRTPKPRVTIAYCRRCGWMPRAGRMAQKLPGTFSAEIGEVVPIPGTGGVFRVAVDGVPVRERAADGGVPDAKALKRRVRNRLAPGRDLGHADRV